jgi:hypothetical protein
MRFMAVKLAVPSVRPIKENIIRLGLNPDDVGEQRLQ